MQIAIVGISCRLPGCPDRRAFWDRLVAGDECLTRFARDEMRADGVPARLLDDPAYVPIAGWLEGAEFFDAGFFNVTPAEARRTDPQQRLLLECAQNALQDAGYAPQTAPGVVSVYAGVGANAHFWRDLEHAGADPSRQFLSYVANDKDFAATRIAWKLGLTGAAVAVQTACSTALAGVHLACQSLLLGESDLALAGACSLRLPQRAGYLYEPDGIESPDGHCRPFDRDAAGTVFGDGVAVLALRRLDDALAAGERVYAVVRGSAIVNDGADKLGFTAPSESGQIGAVAEALAVAGVDPADVSFVETHGTGTALGDAVEVAALNTVFAGARRAAPCPLGSVKANIGHTDTVAGAAGLIKAALALKHGVLPPQPNFSAPNPQLALAERGFAVHTGALPLGERGLAGVSSFGIGGSNVHVVLEAPPQRPARANPAPARARIFPIAAADARALEVRARDLADTVARDAPDPDDLAFTLCRTEAGLGVRAVVVTTGDEAPDFAQMRAPVARAETPKRVFLMPGQGAQYPGMGRALYERFAVYRETIDEAAAILEPILGDDPRRALFEGSDADLAQTHLTQPLVFATDVACARLLRAFGIAPDILIGHSLGEYAAACVADVFDFADGLRLVAARGALMQALPPGRMLAVGAPAAAVTRHLVGATSIAAINAPDATIVSGPPADVEATRVGLEAAGHACVPLATSHAFHSAMMEPMLDAFRAEISRIALRAPRIPVVSNLTGAILGADEATSPDYWCRQLRAPVRFAEGLAMLFGHGRPLLFETGPGRILSSLARRHPALPEGATAHALLPHPHEHRDGVALLLDTVGAAFVAGVDVDWTPLDAGDDRRVADLPPYPFARERHWLEPAPVREATAPDLPEVLVPLWRREAKVRPRAGSLAGVWLVEETGGGLAETVCAALAARGAEARRVSAFEAAIGADVAGVVLLGAEGDPLDRIAALARAIEARETQTPLTVAWLTAGLFDVTGVEPLHPEAAAGIGAMRCLPLEQPCVSVLVADADDPARAAGLLAADLAAGSPDPIVAYRAGRRWLPTDEPAAEPAGEPAETGPITGPVLVTGGTGGVGRIAIEAVATLAGDVPVDVYVLTRTGAGVPTPTGVRLHRLVGDVGTAETVHDAVATIVRRHGRLAGVIHAAGSLAPAGFGPLSGDVAATRAVHDPAKRAGVAVLATALASVEIDFCLLVSSLSTRLGGIGYGAYAAANAVLDATAEAQARDGRPWLAADLDAFVFEEDAAEDEALGRSTGRAAFVRLIRAALVGHTGARIVSASRYAPRREAWVRAATTRDVAAPATHTPAAIDASADPLARIWADVLGVADCGEDENFFELGGSSLLALQILAKVRRTEGVEIALADFLAAPTLAGLRAAIGTRPAAAEPAPVVADRSAPLPILPGQRRIWVAEQMSPERSNFAVEAAYRIDGALDVAALESALSALEARHEPLRTRFVALDGEPHQVIDPRGARRPLEVRDASEHDASARTAFFAPPFDLADGPPWRAALLRHGPERHTLLLCVHHIVVDDWSIGLLLDDFGALYRAARDGAPAAPAAALHFADICVARADRPDDETDIAYWRRALADLPTARPIPADATAPVDDPYAGGVIPVEIPPERLARLRAAAAAAGTTPFVWLLTTFQLALAGVGGARDIVLGTPLAGRGEPGAASVVGYFVNPAVIRLRIDPAERFADTLRRSAEIVVAAYRHGATPFERVQSALGLPAGGSPYHAWMTLLTHAAPRRLDDGLAVTPLRLPDRPARIPIALVLEPEGEGLLGHLEFARGLYREETAAMLSRVFLRLLEAGLAAPETEVAVMLGLCEEIGKSAEGEKTEQFSETQRRRLASARRAPLSAARGNER